MVNAMQEAALDMSVSNMREVYRICGNPHGKLSAHLWRTAGFTTKLFYVRSLTMKHKIKAGVPVEKHGLFRIKKTL